MRWSGEVSPACHSQSVMVVRDGTAVNVSLRSLPVEIIDLVFTEIVIGLLRILRGAGGTLPGVIHEVPSITKLYR